MRYDFLNKYTGGVETHTMSHTQLDEFKNQNPHLERFFSPDNLPGFGDAVRMSVPGTQKADSAFEKYVIDRIKTSVPGNTLHKSHKTSSGNKEW